MLFKPELPHQTPAWTQTKNNWLILFTSRVIIVLTIASIVSIIALWGKLPPLVPLWYSRPWGVDQLAFPIWLFILPVGSLTMYLINMGLAVFFTGEYLVFTQMTYLGSMLVSFLSFISLIKILFLVT